MTIGAIRFVPTMTAMAARPAARPAGPTGFSGSPQASATPQSQPQVTGMDVLKHLMKSLAQPKASAHASQPPATTQPSDSTLMTYSRRDMPKLRMEPGSTGNPGMQDGQNPFKAAKIR